MTCIWIPYIKLIVLLIFVSYGICHNCEGCLLEKLSFLSAVSVLACNAKLLHRGQRNGQLAAAKSWATLLPPLPSWGLTGALLPLDVVRRRQWCPLTLSYCHFGWNVSIDFISILEPFVPSPREEFQEMSKAHRKNYSKGFLREGWCFGLGLCGGRGWCWY